jgi:CDP-glycerol glycerophosphotransferase (TagB/SpsB family)
MVERARGADPRQVRQGLHIPQSDALVVFATQPLARETTECMLRPVVRAVGKLARASLVVKVHPREDTAGYEALVEQMVPRAGNVAVTRDINLGALLVACDVVLTGFSNVAIEAALLNKPVLAINLVGEPDVLPFVDDGIAVGAHTEAEVEQQVASLLTDAAAVETLARTRNAYFERNPYLRDGKATERVVALVEEMVGAGRLHSEGG